MPEPMPADAWTRPGEVLARGRASIVFDLGDGTVLRRCLDRDADVQHEAAVMSHARAHGVPTPVVHRASGADLVMDRVDGVTMLSDVVNRPERAGEHGRLLARLHRLLDAVPPVARPADGSRLLHLDLHPGNVLLSASGPVLVDWTNAASGSRAVDVATTWLVLACMGRTDRTAAALDSVRDRLLAAFLEHVDRAAARSALPVAAAARLADPATTQSERTAIQSLVSVS